MNIIQPSWLCHQNCVELLNAIYYGSFFSTEVWWAPSTLRPSGHTKFGLNRVNTSKVCPAKLLLIPLSHWVPTFHTQQGGSHVALYRGCYCPKESNPAKSFEIKPQLMMAAATELPSVGYKIWCACHQSMCIVCSTIREVTNPLITKKPTDYRPSVPGPTYLEHFFNYLHNVFTRFLTSFRRYIQRLVSMSIADGLASTDLLLLYILAIYLHTYVLCFENTRYIWIRQRLLVTWCISHVRTSYVILLCLW